ncbi:hypothetical protein GGX14DRAFT_409307 [Mycena pura]|uniref:Uncharacterized protein n=1 Tax=Mycena pura TaxID=153505 RepID=A0AAD6Y0G6_9AGAR|nr:hypothetical protein GGX14DRAFT_409307 [Mycena pura]
MTEHMNRIDPGPGRVTAGFLHFTSSCFLYSHIPRNAKTRFHPESEMRGCPENQIATYPGNGSEPPKAGTTRNSVRNCRKGGQIPHHGHSSYHDGKIYPARPQARKIRGRGTSKAPIFNIVTVQSLHTHNQVKRSQLASELQNIDIREKSKYNGASMITTFRSRGTSDITLGSRQ